MAIKAVIFDLDGTLTEPFFDFDLIRKEMGLSRDAGPVLEVMGKMTEEQLEKAHQILHRHEQRAVNESSLNDGAKETLDRLHNDGIHIGILTRNTKENALEVAKKHNLYFDAVIGREDGPAKPDSFGVLNLCTKFGVKPAETLLVGDYLFDLLCAKNAGALAVLLANQENAEEFSSHADFVIDKIDEIFKIIEARKS